MNVETELRSARRQKRKPLLWRVGLLTLVLPTTALAEYLTENRAIEMGLEQPHFNQLLQSQAEAARGNVLTTQTWKNPEFEISREEVGDETETSFWLYQRVNFSDQRKLNSEAANAQLYATESANQLSRLERRKQIQSHFYELLFLQQKQQVFSHWTEKFITVEAAMEKREAAGDVSGYDRRRISRERITLLAEQRAIEAGYQAAREQLSGFIGWNNSKMFSNVEGVLLPETQPALEALLQDLESHPALASLRLKSEAAHLSSKAANRSHIPDITFGIGQKNVDGRDGNDSGLMLSASVPLPLFDRKQGQRQLFAAKAAQAESEYQLVLQQSQAELRVLWHKARKLLENSRLFQQQGLAASYELVRIAETSYHANEIGVLELIDAYRSALDAETTALELALKARMTRVELDKFIEGIQL